MFPNFVIIGAQKSASTFVQYCLSEHPEVYIPKGEIPFFETPDFEQNSLAALERLFDGRREKRLGIKRPNYIGRPEVPGRITKHLPNAKLIAILRNPIHRAISAYYHYINYGFIPVVDVEEGMRSILNNVYEHKYKRAREIIEFGFYSKYLKMYLHFFDRNQIFVITHEKLVSDKLASMQKIYDFLNIDTEFIPTALNSRPMKVIYNLSRLRFLRQRNKLMFTHDADLTRLFPNQAGSGKIFLARLITVIDRLFLSLIFANNRPHPSPELIGLLYNIYKDEIEDLEKFIDRDFSYWKPDIALTGK